MTIEVATVPTLDWLRENKPEILRLAQENRAYGNIRVFGSVARGDANSRSDVDLLVNFMPGASLFDLAALEMHLAELLGVPVDVMSLSARGYAADHARRQAVEL